LAGAWLDVAYWDIKEQPLMKGINTRGSAGRASSTTKKGIKEKGRDISCDLTRRKKFLRRNCELKKPIHGDLDEGGLTKKACNLVGVFAGAV